MTGLPAIHETEIAIEDGDDAAAVRAKIRPALESEIVELVKLLFAGMAQRDASPAGHTARFKAYCIALQSQPAFAIRNAIHAYLGGRVEGANRVFAPSAAELAVEVDRQFWLSVKDRRTKPMPPAEPGERDEPAADAKARVAKLIAETKAALEAASAEMRAAGPAPSRFPWRGEHVYQAEDEAAGQREEIARKSREKWPAPVQPDSGRAIRDAIRRRDGRK